MTDIVIDSSVVIKWFLPEPHAAQARTIRADAQVGALTLLSPDLIYAELGNIDWKKQSFQGLTPEDAQRIINEIRMLPFRATSAVELLDDAYQIASACGRTVYDALYIALGLREGCPFITADERLVNSVAATFQHVAWLGAWVAPSGNLPYSQGEA